MENPLWFAETEGILSADESDLKLEFRTSDAVPLQTFPLTNKEKLSFQLMESTAKPLRNLSRPCNSRWQPERGTPS